MKISFGAPIVYIQHWTHISIKTFFVLQYQNEESIIDTITKHLCQMLNSYFDKNLPSYSRVNVHVIVCFTTLLFSKYSSYTFFQTSSHVSSTFFFIFTKKISLFFVAKYFLRLRDCRIFCSKSNYEKHLRVLIRVIKIWQKFLA